MYYKAVTGKGTGRNHMPKNVRVLFGSYRYVTSILYFFLFVSTNAYARFYIKK